ISESNNDMSESEYSNEDLDYEQPSEKFLFFPNLEDEYEEYIDEEECIDEEREEDNNEDTYNDDNTEEQSIEEPMAEEKLKN
ncbi:3167_t:CDS:1, partial [Paraglomus occultum]